MANYDLNDLMSKKHRPIKDIATDIMRFPINKPVVDPYDRNNDSIYKGDRYGSVLEYLATDKLEKGETPGSTAERRRLESREDYEMLFAAIQALQDGRHISRTSPHSIVIQNGLSLLELHAKELDHHAEDSKDERKRDGGANINDPEREARRGERDMLNYLSFSTQAANIRQHVKPLLRELAEAMDIEIINERPGPGI